MSWWVILILVLCAGVGTIVVLGALTRPDHVARLGASYDRPPPEVFAAISGFARSLSATSS